MKKKVIHTLMALVLTLTIIWPFGPCIMLI